MNTLLPKSLLALAALLSLAIGSAAAPGGGVRVQDAWTRAVPAVSPVAGGFLVIVNDGKVDDRLLRIESAVAKRVEIHQMRNDGGVMRMRQLGDGLAVPAHGRVELKPGGYHLMFIQPTHALVEGGAFDTVFVFQRAGRVKVRFTVRGMGAGAN